MFLFISQKNREGSGFFELDLSFCATITILTKIDFKITIITIGHVFFQLNIIVPYLSQ